MDNEAAETKPDNEQTEKPYGNVDYADPSPTARAGIRSTRGST